MTRASSISKKEFVNFHEKHVDAWKLLAKTTDHTNPFYQLKRVYEVYTKHQLITMAEFHAIRKRCVVAYWDRDFTNSKGWSNLYTAHELIEAKRRFGEIIIKEYVEKQKKELAAGCSKLVFKSKEQIPEEVEGIIQEFIG